MDDTTARVIGGVFIAVCSALGDEAANLAHDVLYGFAENADLPQQDRRVYAAIADAASRDIDEVAAENARFAWLEAKPRLHVVGGTAA